MLVKQHHRQSKTLPPAHGWACRVGWRGIVGRSVVGGRGAVKGARAIKRRVPSRSGRSAGKPPDRLSVGEAGPRSCRLLTHGPVRAGAPLGHQRQNFGEDSAWVSSARKKIAVHGTPHVRSPARFGRDRANQQVASQQTPQSAAVHHRKITAAMSKAASWPRPRIVAVMFPKCGTP